MTYLTSTNESAIDNLITVINRNLGLPNSCGTTTFAVKEKAVNESLWFIPNFTGWAGNFNEQFTAAQIYNNADFADILEQEYNAAWSEV